MKKSIVLAILTLLSLAMPKELAWAGSVSFPADLHSTANRADYLIITADSFYSSQSLLDLATHRASQSDFDVAIVRLSDIYTQFPQKQTDKSIKDFISYAYDNWRDIPSEPILQYAVPQLQYVLLVGDADEGQEGQSWFLPTHTAYGISIYGQVTDNYYASLNDDNGDGNIDDWDTIPDLKIGRFPVKTESELSIVVQKTINYELYNLNGEWLKRVFFVWGEQNAEIPHDPISFVLSADGWIEVERSLSEAHQEVIEKLGNGYDDPQEAINIINEGVGVILYRGHGNIDKLHSLFALEDIEQLTNAPYYPIVLALACSTASFHNADYDAIGEELLVAEGKGTVAFFAATCGSDIYENNREAKAYAQRLFTGIQTRIGNIIFDEKNRDDVLSEHRQILNLLGDPALDISKVVLTGSDKPDLTLSGLTFSNASPDIGDQITITVLAENLGLTAVNDVRVRFFKGDPDKGGTQIGNEHTLSLSAESAQTLSQQWVVDDWGGFYIYAQIRPVTSVEELCSENNKVYLKASPNTSMSGWPKQTEGRIDKINIADIDTGCPGQEIIAVSQAGRVYLWHGDGTEISGWEGGKWLDSRLTAQPAIANVDPNYPGLEIVISSSDRRVFAFHADGTAMLPDSNGVFAIVDTTSLAYPVIADIDKNYPGLEVICTERYGKIYAFHADGTSMLPGQNGLFVQLPGEYRIWQGAILGDINLDGEIEVIIISFDFDTYTEKVFAFRGDASTVVGWEGGVEINSSFNYSGDMAVVEIDPAYPGLEIVISMDGEKPVAVLHADGTIMPSWSFTLPYETRYYSNVVSGNFDPYHSDPEIVVLRGEDRDLDPFTPP